MTMFGSKHGITLAALSVAASVSYVALFVTLRAAGQSGTSQMPGKNVLGVFVGSTPCDELIRPLLQIPEDANAHVIQWKLMLRQDPDTSAPDGYELHCRYGLTIPGRSGLDSGAKTIDRQGSWKQTKGTKSDPDAVVCELDQSVSFVQVDQNILHVLNRDRSLMVGGGGWSYTLYRTEALEPSADPSREAGRPSESYTLSPLATGPTVFGIFGGRSPCQRLARDLNIPGTADYARVKWRVTLFQNPQTGTPTSYKVESSFHHKAAREGHWSIIRGAGSNARSVLYKLDATENESALFLLKGDDDVLFFADQDAKPLVGNADFSYTLNRKATKTSKSDR